MSIVQITAATLSGVLNHLDGDSIHDGNTINAGKGEKVVVTMTGYVGAADVKEGKEYVPGPYGRLPIRAAWAGEGDKERIVLDLAGGLRGVLFENGKKDKDDDADYIGNVEDGDGKEFPLFGRKKTSSEYGDFISLSSMERQEPRQRAAEGTSKPTGGKSEAPKGGSGRKPSASDNSQRASDAKGSRNAASAGRSNRR